MRKLIKVLTFYASSAVRRHVTWDWTRAKWPRARHMIHTHTHTHTDAAVGVASSCVCVRECVCLRVWLYGLTGLQCTSKQLICNKSAFNAPHTLCRYIYTYLCGCVCVYVSGMRHQSAYKHIGLTANVVAATAAEPSANSSHNFS